MFEYHVERGETHEYDQQTEWECAVDAVYTFGANDNSNNGTTLTTTSINCIFTRVFLEDIDLISMGNDDGAAAADEQQTAVAAANNGSGNNKNSGDDDDGTFGGGGGAEQQRHQQQQLHVEPAAEQPSPADNGNHNDNIVGTAAVTASGAPPNVCRRQLALRRKIQNLHFSLTPDGEMSMLEQNFGPLSDVHFNSYKSFHKSKKKDIRYPKRSAPADEISEEGGDAWQTVPGTCPSSSSSSPVENATGNGTDCGGGGGGVEESSLNLNNNSGNKTVPSELLNFDFGFCPSRDAQLVAKNADKHFAKDRVMYKYWYQRNRFFSKLNNGILMDREGWFSVTPERVARHVADRVVLLRDCTVLDAFTGVGGNAIQFALRGAYVIAVDIDPVKLRCARQNARIYGVESRICFICGSFFHVAVSMFGARGAKERKKQTKEGKGAEENTTTKTEIGYPHGVDAVFLSPPWGGPAYLHRDRPFDLLADMEPNGVHIFRVAQQISPNIVYFLPKNTRTDQLIALAGPGGCVELEQTVLNEKIKALHAYFGLLAAN
ncbi:hypothetical protein niasHS_018016 [Heterodera schachtii]|uniref:Trimethylguanosine synthase n=2 Tax=Heterodera schachtii TaxID=97005 RepID=A0ABD2HRM4_HETSC